MVQFNQFHISSLLVRGIICVDFTNWQCIYIYIYGPLFFFLNSPQYSGLNGKSGSITTVWHTRRLWLEELLLIWWVAVNILHKQLQSADKGLSSSLGVEQGVHSSSL